MRHTPLLIVGVALALAAHTATAQRTVRRADLDSSGRLRILISTGRVIRPSKDSGQVAFEQITVSADRRMVGWVALHRNCCTSYPIPLELVLLRADGGRTVIGN